MGRGGVLAWSRPWAEFAGLAHHLRLQLAFQLPLLQPFRSFHAFFRLSSLPPGSGSSEPPTRSAPRLPSSSLGLLQARALWPRRRELVPRLLLQLRWRWRRRPRPRPRMRAPQRRRGGPCSSQAGRGTSAATPCYWLGCSPARLRTLRCSWPHLHFGSLSLFGFQENGTETDTENRTV